MNPDPHKEERAALARAIVDATAELAFYGAAIVFTIGFGVGFLAGWLL